MPWSELPPDLRAAIEQRLGSRVRAATDQPGGFSPGVAARLVLDDGRRAFVKAVHPARNAATPTIYRREAAVVAAMPASAPVPALRWVIDEGPDGWVVLGFDDVEGHQPTVPWRDEELDLVLAALTDLATTLTPSPVPRSLVGGAEDAWDSTEDGWAGLSALTPMRPQLDDWSRRHLDELVDLEATVGAAVQGTTLLHFDIRADNVLLTTEGVRIVDWPHARIGQPWLDLIWFAPSVAMQGGPDPMTLLDRYAPARGADPEAIDAAIAAVAGYFTAHALHPDPPGLPTLRAFQAAQGAIARRWIADRRNWR